MRMHPVRHAVHGDNLVIWKQPSHGGHVRWADVVAAVCCNEERGSGRGCAVRGEIAQLWQALIDHLQVRAPSV